MKSYYQALMLSIVSCLILCTGILSEQVTTSTESNDIPKRIVCYYQSWTWGRTRPYNYDTEDIPTDLCTDIIYAFLRLNGETWELENTQASKPNTDMLLQFTSLGALSTPRPNFLLAVGGGADDSSKWSIMVADPVKRSKFVASALLWINNYSFNGLDLDWEYPGAENKENFVKLVEELVHAFEPYKLLLTSAVSMVERKLKPGYDIQRLSELLDWINVMAYNLRGAWNDFVDVQSPLYRRPFDGGKFKYLNVHDGLELIVGMGAPRHKLMVGIPFHGRSYTLRNSSSHYLTAPANKSAKGGDPGPFTHQRGVLAYYEVCQGVESGNWTRRFDEVGKCPYAFKEDQWVGYDDEQSISIKMDFIKDRGYGGAMVWAINMDDFNGFCGPKNSLLHTIHRGLSSGISTAMSINDTTEASLRSNGSILKDWFDNFGFLIWLWFWYHEKGYL